MACPGSTSCSSPVTNPGSSRKLSNMRAYFAAESFLGEVANGRGGIL